MSCLKICEEVNLYCFHLHGYFFFYHFKKIIYYFIIHRYTYLKKFKIKNNLSKSNRKLRNIIY